MSIISFFENLWQNIKSLFEKIAPDIKDAIHIAVKVVDSIKNFVDSGAADILTSIIPGDLDDKIKTKLREILPKIFTELKLAENCSNLTDSNEIVKCALDTLSTIAGDYKSAFLHDLAILIAQVTADGKLDWKDSVYLVQYYYDHIHKKPEQIGNA